MCCLCSQTWMEYYSPIRFRTHMYEIKLINLWDIKQYIWHSTQQKFGMKHSRDGQYPFEFVDYHQ